MILNKHKLYRTLKTLDTFVNKSLGLEYMGPNLCGFHYNYDLLKAAAYNTYLETVGTRADSIYAAIKRAKLLDIYLEYLKTVEIVGQKIDLSSHDAVFAFDYTNEDFYGKLENIWIHGWTGENAVTGKFKFLTCALVSGDIPQKIPLLSIPIHLGNNLAKDVLFCLSLVRPLVKSISVILFDRGFYSKDLMMTLNRSRYPYLIFVPKNDMVKRELEGMAEDEKRWFHYEFELNKDKTVLKGETTMAFLKKVIDPSNGKRLDWPFATNAGTIDLDQIVQIYKGRWRIETGFRVQDEARISSKSKDIRPRFFLFVYEQLLQLLWVVLYKEEVPFKRFLIEISELCEYRLREWEDRMRCQSSDIKV